MDGQYRKNTNSTFPEVIDLESEASDVDHQTDTIPEIIDLESGASGFNQGMDLNMVIPSDEQVGKNYFTNLLNEDGLLSPIGASTGVDQRLEESHSLNLNLFTGHNSDVLSPLHGASFGNPNSIIDLNADAYEGNDNDVNQEIGSGSISSSFLANGPYGHHNAGAPLSGGTNPSDVEGYLLEQNDNGEGTSGGRRKRRASDGVKRQLLRGESSRSAPQVGSSEQDSLADESTSIGNQQDVNHSEELPAGPEIGDKAADPFKHQPSSAGTGTEGLAGSRMSFDLNLTAPQEENFERNTRFRSSTNQHSLMPANQANYWTAANPQEQSVAPPPTVLFPFDPVPNRISGFHSNPPRRQFLVRAVNYRQTLQLQPVQLPNGVTVFRSPVPPSPTITMIGGPAFSTGHTGTNLNSLVIHQPSASAEDTQVNIEEEFEQIMSPAWNRPADGTGEYARRLSLIVNETDVYHEAARLAVNPFRSRTVVPTLRDNDQRRILLGGPMPQLTAGQRRNRMVSRIRNALAFVRSNATMTFEDLMTIGRPVLNGVPQEQHLDVHENMRVDVDNMSYEELLDLEDQIGYVYTGLNENAVVGHLARATYRSTDPSMEDETCCICQEEYANEELLGRLNCLHYCHYNCIKRWLMEKNVCPICKMKALDI